MSDDIRIWEIDKSSKKEKPKVKPVEAAKQMETEDLLEEVLVGNPDMLMPGLTLVGRQTPVDSGFLDLLGVDTDGRLVVFELKREKLTRDAVAQIIDYCSCLDSLADADFADHITKHSGEGETKKIDDLEQWYQNRHDKPWTSLRPTRMVLVGLGADAHARRMVEFLAERGVDITLLTFNGYRYEGKTLLAMQVEKGTEARNTGDRRRPSQAELRSILDERAAEMGIADLWQDAVKALGIAFKRTVNTGGTITFSLSEIELPDNGKAASSHSVVIDPPGRIRVTFYPVAIHVYLKHLGLCQQKPDVCLERFKQKNKTIPFEFEPPRHPPRTPCVQKQGYCLLDEKEWKEHREALIKLARNVHDAWHEFLRKGVTT